MESRRLLRRAVQKQIEVWDHPAREERDRAAYEVGLWLEAVVREQLPDAIPDDMSLDGLSEMTTRVVGKDCFYVLGAFYLLHGPMLPIEANLDVSPGATSTIKIADEASIIDVHPTSARKFAQGMDNVHWSHHLTLRLA